MGGMQNPLAKPHIGLQKRRARLGESHRQARTECVLEAPSFERSKRPKGTAQNARCGRLCAPNPSHRFDLPCGRAADYNLSVKKGPGRMLIQISTASETRHTAQSEAPPPPSGADASLFQKTGTPNSNLCIGVSVDLPCFVCPTAYLSSVARSAGSNGVLLRCHTYGNSLFMSISTLRTAPFGGTTQVD